jgi:tetratricopeptide (TPR) repeat protein
MAAVNKQAEAYKEKGNEEFRNGDFAKAIENYTYATEMDPKNPVYFTNRSMCYFKMGEHAKSLRDAEKSIKLNNNWVKGYYRAGMAELELGHFKEAVKYLKQAADMEPETAAYSQAAADAKRRLLATMTKAEVTKMEGNELFQTGEIDKAIAKYERALTEVKPVDDKSKNIAADIHANLAMCYQQRWDANNVVASCTNCLELVPNHVKALVRRAQGYESLEKYKLALADFDAACALEPNMEVAYKGAVRVRGTLRKIGAI